MGPAGIKKIVRENFLQLQNGTCGVKFLQYEKLKYRVFFSGDGDFASP